MKKRNIVVFSILPTRLTNGEWIWFCPYVKKQIEEERYVCISDNGWPDIGEWGYRKCWITVEKSRMKI